MNSNPDKNTDFQRDGIIFLSIAVFLTMFFWPGFWLGDGLIGGDVYTYFFPQKSYYANALKAGEFPLWNTLVGHGYPLVAESQTAAFYPPNIILYRFLDVNIAYNISHLVHYVFAFLGVILFTKRVGFSNWSSLLAGVVFVYGWFPVRVCLEWAIITGAYFPWLLWTTESYLQSRNKKWLATSSLLIGLVLLAGHFNLAFIAIVTAVLYSLMRVLVNKNDSKEAKSETLKTKFTPTILITIALLFGFLIAAVQLFPSYELKQLSQRSELTGDYNPGYGHIPGWYLGQVATPWMWYRLDIDLDAVLHQTHFSSIGVSTNKVESHLYFGLIPLLLIIAYGISIFRNRDSEERRFALIWLVLAVLATIYATGWLVSIFQHVPGFSFFTGPGRYGIVTTFAAALFAAKGLQLIEKSTQGFLKNGICVFIIILSAADLWLVAGNVGYALSVSEPPIEYVEDSQIVKILRSETETIPRLFAPGPNMVTNSGFAATPTYLGISPAEYFDPELTMPLSKEEQEASQGRKLNPPTPGRVKDPSAEQIEWLHNAGITHVLSFEPLDTTKWPVEPQWQGMDPFFNRAWARMTEPVYLSKIIDSPGRLAWTDSDSKRSAKITSYQSNSVSIETTSDKEGELVLKDLFYPGWKVLIDENPTEAIRVDGMFRGVVVPSGKHTVRWVYSPGSIFWGGMISVISLLGLIAFFAILLRSENQRVELQTTPEK